MQPLVYADWKAPKADGSLLIWPEGRGLADLAHAQARSLPNKAVRVMGVPLSELRGRTRAYVGHDSTSPLIVTGHQVELHHPGVWVKNAVVHQLAIRTGGRAVHLAVDTDRPKHLRLRFPMTRDGAVPPADVPLTDDEQWTSAEWSGRVSAASPVHATALERQFLAAAEGYGFEPVAPRVLGSLRRSGLEEGVLPPALVSAVHELDWWLGLRYDALLASPLWEYEGFLLVCLEVMTRAEEYASVYNAALAAYRGEHGISKPGRPMPDLRVGPDSVELPFWLDDLGEGKRERLEVVRSGFGWALRLGDDEFAVGGSGDGWERAEEFRSFLRKRNRRIAPRALMLTTFMRLVLSDVFVHGIGGGRYDQVTDRTLAGFWRVGPPGFVVATATLFFPWASGRERACVPCVVQEGHRLRHAVLGAEKQQFLSEIAGLPRRSAARRSAFFAMHSRLESRRRGAESLADWRVRLEEARRQASLDAVLFDRELFYALQPRERLLELVNAVGQSLGG